MTVPVSTNKISYAGDGTTTVFAYPFKIFNDVDLVVVIRDADGNETTKTLGADYTVSGAGSDSGGNVTMTTAPASGETLVIYRDMAITQETDYVEGDPFPASAHENALDKLTMICQQLDAMMNRAVVGKVSTDWDSIDTRLPDPVAGLAIGWNDAADALMNLTSLSGVPITTFGRSLVDDVDAAEARTTLEVYSESETDAAIDDAIRGRLTTGVEYLSSSQVRIPIGEVEINGVIYEVTAVLDLTPTLTASTWHFVFVEAPASGTTVTASEVSVSTTAPTYDAAKGGWYDAGGTKRGIGVFWVNSTPEVAPWSCFGGKYSLHTPLTILSTTAPAITPTAVGAAAPALGNLTVEVNLRGYTSTLQYLSIWVIDGDSAYSTSDHATSPCHAQTPAAAGSYLGATGRAKAITDSSGNIKYWANDAALNTTIKLMGFELPAGLRRTN